LLLAALLATTAELQAADWALPLTGNLLGTVVDGAGTPQVGASIKLFNRYDRVVAKTLSGTDGRFAFAGLAPDFYSLHVALDSFVPAFRDHILVRAGANSMLQINMATLFSNIQWNATIPIGAMTNDWKWVLRTAPATRPITRLLDEDDLEEPATSASTQPQLFSGTRMLVGISGGDAGLVDNGTPTADTGTEFAISTNLHGKNALQVAGHLGQYSDAGPAEFAVGAIYTPAARYGLASSPEIAFVTSQVHMAPASRGADTVSMLRNMSVSIYEASDLNSIVHLEYGITGESVDFMQHSSRISPFARVTAELGSAGAVIAAYSDGGRPDELTAHAVSSSGELENLLDDDLEAPVNALARAPQLSVYHGRLELQRTQDYELGWTKSDGSRTYSFSAFYERVSNGRINVAGDTTALDSSSLLSDGVSTTSIYNIGRYQRSGYLASIDQRVGDDLSVQIGYGRLGGFTPGDFGTGGQAQAEFLGNANHNFASTGIRARIRKTGTRLVARYGWTDPRASIPQHTFTTQNMSLAQGLNIAIRQPLPSVFGMPGRLELMGDLRNMFGEGYLPLAMAGGQRLLVVQCPKAIRGGLNITF
jgi:hypothetical protein